MRWVVGHARRHRTWHGARWGLAIDRRIAVLLLVIGIALLMPSTGTAAPRQSAAPEVVESLIRVGRRVVFTGYTYGQHGRATLWTSDLTPSGTRPLVGAPSGAAQLHLFGFGSYAIAYAVGGDRGRELWRTDGTRQGTRLLAGGSIPAIDYTFTRVGKRLFWIGPEYPGGSTRFDAYLWTTDGTPEGTKRLTLLESDTLGFKDQYDGYSLLAYRRMLILSTRSGELWRSDGSESGTSRLLAGLRYLWAPLTAGGRVYFLADDGQHGRELGVTDGTHAGTRMLADICPGSCDSTYAGVAAVAGGVVFIADDGQHATELWVTDGTETGTRMIADVCSGACDPGILLLGLRIGGRTFFTARDATDGRELWVTDGTERGTRQVRDICRGKCGSDPSNVAAADGQFFFDADDRRHGRELWVTDGTKAATRLVRDICAGRCDSDPHELTATTGGRVLFTTSAPNGNDAWLTDGTSAGTTRLQVRCPRTRACGSSGFVPIRPGLTLFQVYDGRESHPWVVEERGHVVYPLQPDHSIGTVYESLRQHGTLVFSTYGGDVWRTDGRSPGTIRLTPE
jgi:ELWxxDGT repeat protein